MQDYQKKFIDLSLEKGVLKFGSFVLKSGRTSPYFFNAGLFCTGQDLATLGSCYAQAIVNAKLDFDIVFGPAYKGIPLATATAMALAAEHNINVPWCFNRKEVKDHGEGGSLVGAKLAGNVLVIDDVITAGTAIRESYNIIKGTNSNFTAAIIALNRQERGQGDICAIDEIKQSLGIDIISIITFDDLLTYIEEDEELSQFKDAMNEYRQRYGA